MCLTNCDEMIGIFGQWIGELNGDAFYRLDAPGRPFDGAYVSYDFIVEHNIPANFPAGLGLVAQVKGDHLAKGKYKKKAVGHFKKRENE